MQMEQIKKFTLLIGLRDKDTKEYKISQKQAKELIKSIVGTCTLSDADGVYIHDDGTRIEEKCIRVELLFKQDKEVLGYCQRIKKELNQESVALSVGIENSALV